MIFYKSKQSNRKWSEDLKRRSCLDRSLWQRTEKNFHDSRDSPHESFW